MTLWSMWRCIGAPLALTWCALLALSKTSHERWSLGVALVPRAKGAARGWPASTRRPWLSVTTTGLSSFQSSRAWPRGGRPPWGGYGFTLHLIVNDEGELLALHVSPGNGDDRRLVEFFVAGLGGQRFG